MTLIETFGNMEFIQLKLRPIWLFSGKILSRDGRKQVAGLIS
jgi:hypothetical protein